jgi:hypothetical protein
VARLVEYLGSGPAMTGTSRLCSAHPQGPDQQPVPARNEDMNAFLKVAAALGLRGQLQPAVWPSRE